MNLSTEYLRVPWLRMSGDIRLFPCMSQWPVRGEICRNVLVTFWGGVTTVIWRLEFVLCRLERYFVKLRSVMRFWPAYRYVTDCRQICHSTDSLIDDITFTFWYLWLYFSGITFLIREGCKEGEVVSNWGIM
jgi:hypothetical protein